MFSGALGAMAAAVLACGHRLTVDEHIWFYGRLKGLSVAAMSPEQDQLLRNVGLVPKRHTQTRHLSSEPSLEGRGVWGGVVTLPQGQWEPGGDLGAPEGAWL